MRPPAPARRQDLDAASGHRPSPCCVSTCMPSRTGVWQVRTFGRRSTVITHSKQRPIPQ